MRSLAAAKQEWSRIKAANSAALQGAPVYFERADLKGRGVFYRILIGPEQDRANAHTLCTALKQNKQSCVVMLRNAAEIQRNAEHQRDGSQDGAVKADSEVKGGLPPSATSMPKSGPAEPIKPAVATPVPAPPSSRAAHDEGVAPPPASSAASGVALPRASPQARSTVIPAPRPVAETPQPTAAANANTGPKAGEFCDVGCRKPRAGQTGGPGKAHSGRHEPGSGKSGEAGPGPPSLAPHPAGRCGRPPRVIRRRAETPARRNRARRHALLQQRRRQHHRDGTPARRWLAGPTSWSPSSPRS